MGSHIKIKIVNRIKSLTFYASVYEGKGAAMNCIHKSISETDIL